MKIMYVTDAFAICGGLEMVLTDKINCLQEHYGFEVTLLTINQGKHLLSYELNTQVKHIDIGVRMHQQYQYCGIKKLLKRQELIKAFRRKMKHALEEIKPDVIVCVKLDLISVLADLKGNAPLVVESHTLCKSEQMDDVGWLRKLYVWSLKRSISKVDVVVALTEGDAADWRRYHKNVCVIPNVVHLNKGGRYANCKQKNIIFVGRFSKQKDIDTLLVIWNKIHYHYPCWKLDIFGEGELEKYYLPKIQCMNANINVYFPTKEIMERYCEHSILMMTSLYEPFGLVLPEAMSCGLPVVAFDCPYGPADIITDGVDGFLVKNRDIDAFVDKVCLLIENKDLRRQMGQNGIASSQRYRADIIMPKWIKLFKQLTSGQ